MFDATRPGWKTTVDNQPTTGPKGTVLVECRRNDRALDRQVSIHRYWIDPRRDYLVMREELICGDPQRPSETQVAEIVEVGRTPSGLPYPKLVRIPDSSRNLDTGEVSDDHYRYFVDFAADVRDELFVIEE